MLERKQAHRHPLQDIDIKTSDQIQPPRQLALRTSKNQEISKSIDTDHRIARNERSDQLCHRTRAEILQRNDYEIPATSQARNR